jgi:CBS domain-containing protein
MSPNRISRPLVRDAPLLRENDTVEEAVRAILESGLPALPVVDDRGELAGIFGEREFMAALFPAYVGTLAWSAMISRSIDEAIERRESCREEPIRKYLTSDHVVVDENYSDTQLAELFLHHRVLIIPIAIGGRISAVVTRSDFFKALSDRLGG